MSHLTGLKTNQAHPGPRKREAWEKFPATGMERDQEESLLGESPSSHPRRRAVRGMERAPVWASLSKGQTTL